MKRGGDCAVCGQWTNIRLIVAGLQALGIRVPLPEDVLAVKRSGKRLIFEYE